MTQTIFIQGNTFILHPTGCLYWKERKMLMIADVHLGKISHFRKSGIAVPSGPVKANFAQLDKALNIFEVDTLCFLGDLFHSEFNNEWNLFSEWVGAQQVDIVLVAGNHDILTSDHYENIGINVCSEWVIEDFLLTHHPQDTPGYFNFAGHIHPGVKLRGTGKQWLKLPCFFKRENQMILPAFGKFTGIYLMVPTANDCVYAVTKDEVVLVC